MPDQVMVTGVDEQGTAHHGLLSQPIGSLDLEGRRVVVADLDSGLPAGRAGLRHGAPPPEWIADFVFRHFRGVVIDWVLNRGSYRLADKLRQDYRFFEGAFRSGGPAQQPEGAAHP